MPAHLNYQAGYTKGYTTGFKVCLACSFLPVTAACLFSSSLSIRLSYS